ncbi:UDP-2,3-diacylglucosamine diphosphatase [Sphingomonas sp.]|jgi:UDP-2,3-diacylglucosamine pyrophosphatase LpxH|uniref:UDP-2,3-diacylglucosamine diphosphatase n=1 Tax=Sphingomonas sp. TaxID=28214 RepID=UPI002EDB318E
MASLPDLPLFARRDSSAQASARIAARLPAWLADPDDGTAEEQPPRTRYRTIWISDLHLGTTGSNAAMLLTFLKSHECETLYLVGDIIDGWRLRKGWYWPQSHNDVIRAVLKMAKHGTRVIYIPGNHDEHFRDYVGLEFGGIELLAEDVHVTADGRRLLVIHGDQFDNVMLYARWLAFLGDRAYTMLLRSNGTVNWVRRRLGLPYWSLAAHMKKRVKNAVQFISRYEEVVAHAAAERRVDGVVCGHIHSPEIRRFGDITYYNDGDWVESCTALVEDAAGAMSLIDWAEHMRAERRHERTAPRLVASAEPVPA